MKLAQKLRSAGGGSDSGIAEFDPFWSNVTLLLTAEGTTEGSTTFIDKSNYNTPISINSYTNPIYNTKSQSLVGNIGSIYFDPYPAVAEGSHLIVPYTNDNVELSTLVQWTYEAYVRPVPNFHTNTNCGVLYYGARGINNYRIELELLNASDGYHYLSGWIQGSTSTGIALNPSSAFRIPTEQWSHLAITRNYDIYSIFVNGVKAVEKAYERNWSTNHSASVPQSLIIGLNRQSGVNCSYKGHIDQIRVTKVVRYTQDFIPDFKPFPTK